MALESLVFPLAENLLGKLASQAYQEIALAWGVKTELEKLKDILSSVEAVLSDAEEQQEKNNQLRDWLAKLKDVFYDVEDVLDEFECEDLRRQVVQRRSISKRVGHFFSSSNSLIVRMKLGKRVKEIRERLDEMAANKNKFGLSQGNKHTHRGNLHRETHSFVRANDVIGREADKESIIEHLMLTIDGQNLSTVSIVGLGGLGKTVLAKLVYNDERIVKYFQLKMWVCISDDFDLKVVVPKIIESATGKNQRELVMGIDQLQSMLRGDLDGKRFLLVLDDVWNEDPKKWFEELKPLLVGGDNGSKIVVTTRSKRVAEIMGTNAIPPHNLSGLPIENCLPLFLKYAFRAREEKQYPVLMKIGKEIVDKCKGVPLAIITMGSLLYANTDEDYWKYVRDNDIWKLEQKENDILPALRLSYEQLPSHLKRCFVYCALFPKDSVFTELLMVQFWMAHGLLQSTDEEMEVVGSRYLKELRSRCFFQDFIEMGIYTSFKMHDLVHDVALSVARTECVMITSARQEIPKTIRHFLISNPKLFSQDFLMSSRNFKCVRTIFFQNQTCESISESVLETCFSRCQHLWALDLRLLQFGVLPRGVGNLKHLRYLNLFVNKEIRKLPESICKLQSLQNLLFGACYEIEDLPRDIRYLINLRLLEVTTKQKRLPKNGIGCLKSLRVLIIRDCKNLEYLFEDMQGLINLRTLVIIECESLISLPQTVKYLTALENLYLSHCANLDLTLEEAEHKQDFSPFGLRKLVIQDLPKLVYLPQWVLSGSANTIQSLEFGYCHKIRELPLFLANCESLQKLEIYECELLRDRCESERGADWLKIAHVPQLIIDGRKVKLMGD